MRVLVYHRTLSELSEPTIGAIGAHYCMLRDHAKVTMGEVEHNHTHKRLVTGHIVDVVVLRLCANVLMDDADKRA